jgi:hypothetical protein
MNDSVFVIDFNFQVAKRPCLFKAVNMPTWNHIQSQLRNPNNPVVFFDISVGTTVSILYRLGLHVIDVMEIMYNTCHGLNQAQLHCRIGPPRFQQPTRVSLL